MTLTRLLPTLRRSIPDPLDRDLWPEATIATTTDLVVAGLSLVRLAEVCGTPCAHHGPAVSPGTGGQASTTMKSAVLVVRVTRAEADPSGCVALETDADLDGLPLVWSQTRLVGRASAAAVGVAHIALRRAGGHAVGGAVGGAPAARVELPKDLRAGDLLAVPTRPVETAGGHGHGPLGGAAVAEPRPHRAGRDLEFAQSPAWLSQLR
jgi:hypothetical protein